MNNESKTLWISLGAGIFAAFLLYSYSMEKKAEYDAKNGAVQNVVVAAVDISEMQTVDDSMLEVRSRPGIYMEPSAIKDPEQAVGQVAATPIKKGEQILTTKLLQPGPDTGIALQVAPSKRAVTIPIDDVRGVAKLIRPGDRVDIVAAIDSGRGVAQKREVIVLMDDVVILATGVNVVNNLPRTYELDSGGKNINQISLTGNTSYGTVTIEASPKEAQDLIYILSTSPGNLYFTLRNPNDRKAQPRLPASTAESVLGRSASLDLPPQPVPSNNYVPPTQVPQARPSVPAQTPKKQGFRSL
jgi:pilus assembly protein CpaB